LAFDKIIHICVYDHQMNKRYELLNSLPAYGQMYVSVTENDEPFYSEGMVIRFFKTDGTDWIANFQPGWTDLNMVYELPDLSGLLVIAGGTCYIMLPDKKQPAEVFGVSYREVVQAGDGRLILQDGVYLTIVEKNGEYWDSQRISWDGIKNLSIEGNLVMGLLLNPMNSNDEWIPFSYDINTKVITGGSFNK
jgi:hypothetical protein